MSILGSLVCSVIIGLSPIISLVLYDSSNGKTCNNYEPHELNDRLNRSKQRLKDIVDKKSKR